MSKKTYFTVVVNATSAVAVLDDARGNLKLEKSENVEP